jgi:Flp pilus assembly protein TadD
VSLGLFLGVLAVLGGQPRPVTFNSDIARIVQDRCVSCHTPGGIAPFSLLTYDDVRQRATLIADVTKRRVMPPWMPTDTHFLDSRALTDEQIDLIQRWVAQGAVEGNPAEAPRAAARAASAREWQLGTPDLILRLDREFVVAAGGADVFRTFVLPVAMAQPRYVRALEFQPSNPRVVHHVNMGVDRTAASRRLDEADSAPGYFGNILPDASHPPGQMLGWTPGQRPRPVPAGTQWRLEPGDDLVVQLHLQPTGKPEPVQPSIGLFFTDEPPARTPVGLRLGRETIDIAAGVREHMIGDTYVLPVDVEALAIQPHAHNLARRMEASATLPDGTRRTLISIPAWDFRWQEVYRFTQPVPLPRGTTLSMRYSYDNSTDNPRNPHTPPRRVTWGQNTSDEMGDLWIQMVPRANADFDALSQSVANKMRAEDLAAYTKLAKENPANEEFQNAVAVLHLQNGAPASAVPFLRASLKLKPESAPARFNLGLALAGQRQFGDALKEFDEALRIDPRHAEALYSSGAILQAQGRLADAVARYRRAVEVNPEHATAHTNLAAILGASGDAALRAPAEALRHAEKAAALTGRGDAAVLDVLGIACAANGQFERARESAAAALRLARDSGNEALAQQIAQRLALYEKGVAFRLVQ